MPRSKITRRLFRLVRAARTVQHSADPFAHLRLCEALEAVDLELPAGAFGDLPVDLRSQAKVCLRQRLVSTLVYHRLLAAMMCHVARPGTPVQVAAPSAWRAHLRLQGVVVGHGSMLRWWAMVTLFYGLGVRTAASLATDCMRRRCSAPDRPYAVVMHLQPANVPRRVSGPAFDFVSWYKGSALCHPAVREVWAHAPRGSEGSRPRPDIVIRSSSLQALDGRRFSLWISSALWLLIKTAAYGLAGRWWDVVLLEQRMYYEYARRLRREEFARAYLFNNSLFVVRPLWTYVAEAAGATIDLVFYATNIETFGLSPADPRPYWPGYRGMTWQRYGVWDDNQAQLIRDFGHRRAAVIVVGPVSFTDSAAEPTALPSGSVVIFDVTPQRLTSLARRGIPQPYYTSRTWRRFLDDVVGVVSSSGLRPVYKKKREIGKVSAGTFRTETARRAAAGAILAVDPDEAAHQLIARASAVVSMPFTSTALIARAMGKPSVYYDPLGVLANEDRLAHGVQVIGNPRDLRAWMLNVQANLILTGSEEVAAS